MSIIAFQTFQNDFNVGRDPIEQSSHKSFHWGDVPSDNLSLSTALNNQCKLNLNNLLSYMNLCDLRFEMGFETGLEFESGTKILSNPEDIIDCDTCTKLNNSSVGYLDVLFKDHNVFNGLVSHMPHALVLLDEENNYCGHIYVWIYENNVYCMGIRNNVKSLFSKSKLKNVSSYLLEGVRRFALHFGFDNFNVMMPVSKMKFILETKFHFEQCSIDPKFYIFNPLIEECYIMKSGDIRHKKFVEEIYFGLALE